MTVIISGDNGVSDVDGSAGTPAIRGTDANTGIFFPAADRVGVSTGGTQRVEVDASGRVGIGTTSPATRLQINGDHVSSSGLLRLNANSGQRYATLSLWNDTTAKGFLTHDNTDNFIDLYASASQGLRFSTNDAERARIDTSGNFIIANTVVPNWADSTGSGWGWDKTNKTMIIKSDHAESFALSYYTITSYTSGTAYFFQFRVNGSTVVGNITTTGSTTTYATSSDYRLKENIAPMTGALDTVAALKPVTYTWKIDGSAGQGFIAHELQEVVPDCVTGEKDAVDEDGNIKPQGIDTSFLVATLTAAIQELKAINDAQASRIETLEAKVAALEAK